MASNFNDIVKQGYVKIRSRKLGGVGSLREGTFFMLYRVFPDPVKVKESCESEVSVYPGVELKGVHWLGRKKQLVPVPEEAMV